MTTTHQPEALRLLDWFEESDGFKQGTQAHHKWVLQAEQELRRQYARISELEAARIAYASEFESDADGDPDVGNIHANIRALKAQLSAIGAGGVEPLRKHASLQAEQVMDAQTIKHISALSELVRMPNAAEYLADAHAAVRHLRALAAQAKQGEKK